MSDQRRDPVPGHERDARSWRQAAEAGADVNGPPRAERPGRFVYEDERSRGRRLWQQVKWLLGATALIVVIAFGAGILFGQSTEGTAARSLLGSRVVTEPEVTVAPSVAAAGVPDRSGATLSGDATADAEVTSDATPTNDELPEDFAVAPTSGRGAGDAVCGVRETPLDAGRQVATLKEGAIIVQYRPGDATPDAMQRLAEFAAGYDSHVLVAPNPDLDTPVVATAFRNRLRLPEVQVSPLETFVTGYRRPQGPAESCPVG